MRRLMYRLVGFVAAATLIVACGGTGSGQDAGSSPTDEETTTADAAGSTEVDAEAQECTEMTQVTFVQSTPELSPHTAYYTSLPDVLGFWEEECLDVVVQPSDSASGAAQSMLSGQTEVAHLGLAGAAGLWEGAQEMRVVTFSTTKSFYETVVPADSDISSFEDLEGRDVGVQSLGSASYFIARGLVDQAGADPEAVNWIPVDVGAGVAQAFETGDIEAYAAYDGPVQTLRSLGLDMVELSSSLSEQLGGFSGYVVTEDYLTNNQEAVIGLARGILKAQIFARENPEASIRLHYERYPDTRPAGMTDEESVEEGVIALDGRLASVATSEDGLEGYVRPEDVQETFDFMLENGIVEQMPDLDMFIDMSFIEEMNDFDKDEILQMARDA